MQPKELKDLTVSALVLALAFGIAFAGGYQALLSPGRLVVFFFMALIGVSSGFVLHELGHRFVARRFGCFAEYTMWLPGLLIALGLSLFGFIFAAPGAVMIYPRQGALTGRKNGLISLVGPVMNLSLAVVFLVLALAYPAWVVFALGARINTWLAVFNLLPFGPLDGGKILHWSRGAWLAVLAAGVGLFLAESLLP